jgi:hypothetical protein
VFHGRKLPLRARRFLKRTGRALVRLPRPRRDRRWGEPVHREAVNRSHARPFPKDRLRQTSPRIGQASEMRIDRRFRRQASPLAPHPAARDRALVNGRELEATAQAAAIDRRSAATDRVPATDRRSAATDRGSTIDRGPVIGPALPIDRGSTIDRGLAIVPALPTGRGLVRIDRGRATGPSSAA